MTGIIFDPEDLEDDLESGKKPDDGKEEEDKDQKPTAPSFSDFRVPDDYEDEELRGLDGQSLIQALKQSKELTKRAIEQANSASGAATAAATAAVAAAGSGTAPAAPVPTEITKEDLLLADPKIINDKISAIFAEKARPVLVEQYTKMSHQALALARSNKASMPWWDDYENEIITEANKLSVDLTASIETWKGLYGTVIARHHEEIIDKEIEKRAKKTKDEDTKDEDVTGAKLTDLTGRRVTVVDTGERGKGGGGGGKSAPKLDDDQRRTAKLLGVAEEDYAKYATTGEEE